MTVEARIGQLGVARVRMTDAQGAETDTYDVIEGIKYTSSNPDAVAVQDDDAEPKDARIDFLALSDTEVFIEVSFDGDPGDGMREIILRSEGIRVVPGEATGGTVEIQFAPV